MIGWYDILFALVNQILITHKLVICSKLHSIFLFIDQKRKDMQKRKDTKYRRNELRNQFVAKKMLTD